MKHRVTLIKGDGIGPEVIDSAVRIIDKAHGNIEWQEELIGLRAIEKYGTSIPENTLQSIKNNKVALKGPTNTPIGGGHVSANVGLRKSLDLYSCIRPVKSLKGIQTRYDDVDLVIFRENTEGLYCGQEVSINQDIVASLRIISKNACLRIAKAAFDYAQKNNRKKITVAHKANILKKADGLYLECIQKIKKDYPKIDYEEVIVDALCMKLVMNPARFDVIILENMFGDIVSDLASGFVGGLGISPGANIGDDYAVFEAVHGSADDIAGQNKANPIAMIQSGILLLRHMAEHEAADKIHKALVAVLQEKSLLTRDLGGESTTQEFTQHLVDRL